METYNTQVIFFLSHQPIWKSLQPSCNFFVSWFFTYTYIWVQRWVIDFLHCNIPLGLAKPTFNSLTPRKFQLTFRYVIFKRILVIDGWGISFDIALVWMSLDFTDDQSTLVQVMAWCHQARERERLSLSAFLRTEDIGVHIVHISRLIITYTLE